MNFNELFQKMRELDQPVQESDKASKDYDGDGEVESGKDEYMGSRDKAIKKATGNDDDETKESLDQLATEVQHEMDECGMSPMSSPMGMAGMNKQQDNVSMNINMTGSGGGGIRDLMDILRNIEKGSDDHSDHDDGLDMKLGGPALMIKKDPVLDDEWDNSPNPVTKTSGAFPTDTGDDLHRPRGAYPAVAGGDNPMAMENIISRLDKLYTEVKEK
jgi:hypothetical protein